MKSKFKVALLTQGELIPSTRFRLLQYVDMYKNNKINTRFYHARQSAYPPTGFIARIIWLVRELLYRISQINEINRSDVDVVILQRELISTLPTLEFLIRKPYVFDVDDAIFLHRNGLAAKKISRRAKHIVCGNNYLADFFKKYNQHLTEIPTPVDTERFVPGAVSKKQNYIGWSGSSSGFDFLYQIEAQLLEALLKFPGWKIFIVSDKRPEFRLLTNQHYDFEQWSPDNEVITIQKMDIGLMPLSDDLWSRGKCSYKMLLYMACGVPCVVSNVGMNKTILEKAEVGVGVEPAGDWVAAISRLVLNSNLRQQMGQSGRELVINDYSLTVAGAKWLKVLEQVVRSDSKNG